MNGLMCAADYEETNELLNTHLETIEESMKRQAGENRIDDYDAECNFARLAILHERFATA